MNMVGKNGNQNWFVQQFIMFFLGLSGILVPRLTAFIIVHCLPHPSQSFFLSLLFCPAVVCY